MLSPDGWLITNTKPFVNITNYPEIETVIEEIKKQAKHIVIDADTIAKDLESPRSANMVMLGAATLFMDMDIELFDKALKTIFGRKGDEVVNTNIAALKAGREAAQSYLK